MALAKARPGALNYASSGNGTGVHLTSEMFKLATGINMAHVPYKSAGPATVALLSGEVKSSIENDGNAVIANSPQEFMAFIRTESEELGEVIRIARVGQ